MVTRLAPFLVMTSLALLSSACVVESKSDPPTDSAYPSASAGGGGSATPGSTGTSSTPAPMLVLVDTDQTMNAAPGDGVGVFVEYKSGGGWHVWWTCDTNHSNQSCAFDITVSTASGVFSDLAEQGVDQAAVVQDASGLHVNTTSTTDLQGLTFGTDAGGVITVEAHVSGLADGSFLFFVQDGKVNGGYTGTLTNPLQFQGNKP